MKIETIKTGTGEDGRIKPADIVEHHKEEKHVILRAIAIGFRILREQSKSDTSRAIANQITVPSDGRKLVVGGRWEIVVQNNGARYDDQRAREAVCAKLGHQPGKAHPWQCVKCNAILDTD